MTVAGPRRSRTGFPSCSSLSVPSLAGHPRTRLGATVPEDTWRRAVRGGAGVVRVEQAGQPPVSTVLPDAGTGASSGAQPSVLTVGAGRKLNDVALPRPSVSM